MQHMQSGLALRHVLGVSGDRFFTMARALTDDHYRQYQLADDDDQRKRQTLSESLDAGQIASKEPSL